MRCARRDYDRAGLHGSLTILRHRARPTVPDLARLAALAVVIGLATWVSIDLTRLEGNVSSVWIGNGILIASMLYRPTAAWPAMLVAGTVGSVTARIVHGDPGAHVATGIVANLLEILLIAGTIRRRVPDVRDPARLVVLSRTAMAATLAACAASGAIGAGFVALRGGRSFFEVWLTWYTAHVLGVVIAGTLIMVARREGRHLFGRRGRQLDFFLCLALLLCVCVFVFAQERWPLLFLVLPPLLLFVFRHKFAGVAAGVLLIAATGAAAAAFGAGPFGLIASPTLLERTLLLQIFVGTSCLLALPVAIELTHRSRLVGQLKLSELRYRTLAENARDIVARMYADGSCSYVSPAVTRVLGWQPTDFARPRWDLIHPEDVDALRAAHARVFAEGGSITVSARMRHRDGDYVWIETVATRVETDDPRAPAEIVSSGRDISQRMAVRAALAESQARLRAVTDNIPALVAHVDAQERYTYVNAQYQRLVGLGAADMIGRTVRETRGDAAYRRWQPHIAAALRGEPQVFEHEPDAASGGRYLQLHYVPDVADDGTVRGFFALTFDITPLKLAERELARLARVDTLTGLGNRRQFEERGREALLRARRHGTPLALMALDLDRFKAINDSLGHPAGDVVLQRFAERLRACVREIDLVARLGGDEFVVLVEDAASEDIAELVARKLLEEMRAPILVDGLPLRVQTSIGIAWSRNAATLQELTALADRALYAAKAEGRNTFVLMTD